MAIGLGMKKEGCSTFWSESDNVFVGVTVLSQLKSFIIDMRTVDLHGYNAVRVFISEDFSLTYEKFLELGVKKCKGVIKEFRIDDLSNYVVGQYIDLSFLEGISAVDVSGVSKGKGFAGVMKRHGFSGLAASHGVSISHRSFGSTGACQDPGRVWRGKKMAGRMGCF